MKSKTLNLFLVGLIGIVVIGLSLMMYWYGTTNDRIITEHIDDVPGEGWNLHEGTYTFVCPDGSRATFQRSDIVYDPNIIDGGSFVEVTTEGLHLHVPYEL